MLSYSTVISKLFLFSAFFFKQSLTQYAHLLFSGLKAENIREYSLIHMMTKHNCCFLLRVTVNVMTKSRACLSPIWAWLYQQNLPDKVFSVKKTNNTGFVISAQMVSSTLWWINYCLSVKEFPKMKVVPPMEKDMVIFSLYKNVRHE